jgi:hypothetical protein
MFFLHILFGACKVDRRIGSFLSIVILNVWGIFLGRDFFIQSIFIEVFVMELIILVWLDLRDLVISGFFFIVKIVFEKVRWRVIDFLVNVGFIIFIKDFAFSCFSVE